MSHEAASHHKESSGGGGKGKNIIEGLTMGMFELAHKSGLGAIGDAKDSISHLFGAEGGGHGGGHKKGH